MDESTKRIGIGAAIGAVVGAGLGVALGTPAAGAALILGGVGAAAGGGAAYAIDKYNALPGVNPGGGGGGGYVAPTGHVTPQPDGTPIKSGAPGPAATLAETRKRPKLGGTPDAPAPSFADALRGLLPGAGVTADKDRTIDQLPEAAIPPWAPYGLRTAVRDVLADPRYPHDKTGWAGSGAAGPAFVWQKLRDLGYARAASQVIYAYLPDAGAAADTPGSGPLSFAGGGI